MKSIKFNNHEITIVYSNEEKAQKSNWIFYKHELDKVTIEGNTVTFQYKGLRFLDAFVKDIFAKTCDDVRTETDSIDKGTVVSEIYTIVTGKDKIFKITYTNERGTIGKYGFGCWQFGSILRICNNTLTIRNSYLDEAIPTLDFSEGEVLIEIGEFQF